MVRSHTEKSRTSRKTQVSSISTTIFGHITKRFGGLYDVFFRGRKKFILPYDPHDMKTHAAVLMFYVERFLQGKLSLSGLIIPIAGKVGRALIKLI